MELFFTPPFLLQQSILPEQESFHCIKVLRHKEGDVIHIVDGEGHLYEAKITHAHKEHCAFRIIREQNSFNKRNFHLHIAIAPTKSMERFEWLLEKVTEIGIDEITPLICAHSERRKLKTDRLNNILISAMKQSLKAFLPKLNEPADFKKFTDSQQPSRSQKLICHLADTNKIHLNSVYEHGNDAIILIGPEGDFSKEEIILAEKKGFQQVILSESRLRTETAGLVACHIINLKNEAVAHETLS